MQCNSVVTARQNVPITFFHSEIPFEFFGLNLILSEVSILCRSGLQNLKQNCGNRTLDSSSSMLLPTLTGHLLVRLRLEDPDIVMLYGF